MDPTIKVRQINLSRKEIECQTCGSVSRRYGIGHRWLREIGIKEPIILEVIYSKHRCEKCGRIFNIPTDHLAQDKCNFTSRVRRTAVDLVAKQNFTLEKAKRLMQVKYHVTVSSTTIHDWVAIDTCLENIE